MQKVNKDIQTGVPIYTISAYYNSTSHDIIKRRIAGLMSRDGEYAKSLAALPPFIVCAVGTRSRCESAPHSDCDYIVVTVEEADQTERSNIRKLWEQRGGGAVNIGFGPEDVRAAPAATPTVLIKEGGLIGPDLLVLYANHPDQVDRILGQFYGAIAANRENNKKIIDAGLGNAYDSEVDARIKNTYKMPPKKIQLKTQLRIFSFITGRMALYCGEKPNYGGYPPFTHDRLLRYLPLVEGLSHEDVEALVIAHQELFTLRYILHSILPDDTPHAETNTFDGSDKRFAELYARWEKNVWPRMKEVLPKLDQLLKERKFDSK